MNAREVASAAYRLDNIRKELSALEVLASTKESIRVAIEAIRSMLEVHERRMAAMGLCPERSGVAEHSFVRWGATNRLVCDYCGHSPTR